TFTISSNDYMQHALLVPFVKVLRSEARQIQLAIAPPIIEGLSDALARGQIDLAVTIPEFAISDLPSRLLYRERYVVAVEGAFLRFRRLLLPLQPFLCRPHVGQTSRSIGSDRFNGEWNLPGLACRAARLKQQVPGWTQCRWRQSARGRPEDSPLHAAHSCGSRRRGCARPNRRHRPQDRA